LIVYGGESGDHVMYPGDTLFGSDTRADLEDLPEGLVVIRKDETGMGRRPLGPRRRPVPNNLGYAALAPTEMQIIEDGDLMFQDSDIGNIEFNGDRGALGMGKSLVDPAELTPSEFLDDTVFISD